MEEESLGNAQNNILKRLEIEITDDYEGERIICEGKQRMRK